MAITTYDPTVDALSIDLLPGSLRARTERGTAGELLHYDAEGRLFLPTGLAMLGLVAALITIILKR